MAPDTAGFLRRWLPVLLASAALLCAVAIVNGGPIIYPDSLAYLIDADRLFHRVAPYAVRPVFYGLAVWPLHWGGQVGLALFAQALVIAHILYLVARSVGAGLRPLSFLLLIVGLILLTPLPWHVAHLLPDVFVAVLILALYLLAFCRDGLSRAETVYLVLLAAAATSFHITAIPVALAAFAFVLLVFLWDRSTARPFLALLPILLALAGSLAFNYAIWQRVTLTPNSPPHLLARLLADGPAKQYLRDRCPGADLELCAYLDRLPPTEDGFLWDMLPSIPTADGKRIKAEAGTVIRGTIETYPGAVIGHMLANTLRQLVTIRSETQFRPDEWAKFESDGTPLARQVAHSLQAQGAFERPALNGINALHAAVAILSLFAAVPLLARALALGQRRPALLLLSVLLGLLSNAFACGAFGGVFGRYEGRVIWLLPFAAVTAALALSRSGASRRTRAGDASQRSANAV